MSGASEVPASEQGSRGPLLLAGALFSLVLAVAVLLLGRTADRGEMAEAYSTFRATPEGAKAAYLVLERLGYPVRRHTEEMFALDGVDVLVVLEPAISGGGVFKTLFDERETRALELYVRDGGCLVVASSIETPLHQRFGVRLLNAKRLLDFGIGWTTTGGSVGPVAATAGALPPDDEDDDAPVVALATTRTSRVVPAVPSVYSQGIARLEPLEHRRRLETGTATAVPIFRRVDGQDAGIEAVAVRSGRGHAVFFADPTIFSNRAIARADNALALVAVAAAHVRDGVVAFDEMHHGFAVERGMTGYLGRRSLAPVIVQAALAFLVLAIALGGRRGRPPILAEDRPPQSIEHVRAMAEIYGRARLHKHVVERLYTALIRDIEAHLGFAPTVRAGPGATTAAAGIVKDGPVTEALRERGVRGFRMLETISARVRRLEAMSSRSIPEAELLHLAREIGRFEEDCRRALGQRFGEVRGG